MTTNRQEMYVLPEHLFGVTNGYEDEVIHGFAISQWAAQQYKKKDTLSQQPKIVVKSFWGLDRSEQLS